MTHRTLELAERRGGLPLEEAACVLCGEAPKSLLVDDPPFKVWACGGCGMGFTSPRVRADRLADIYDLGYFSSESAGDFGYASYSEDAEGYFRTFERKANLIARHLPSGRVLEIGCAAGFFLKVLERRGYDVHGVEVSGTILAHARDVLKLPHLFHGTLDAYPGEPGSFDAIMLWDVVEHLADPVAVLKQARTLLKPGGWLFLQTQDVSSMTRRVLGAKWTHFKQLEHVWHFSPSTIRELLARAGFETVEVRKRGAGKDISVGFIIDRMKRFSGVLHAVARLFSPWSRKFVYVNPWDEIVVAARRKDA